jgi:hypothetical protein
MQLRVLARLALVVIASGLAALAQELGEVKVEPQNYDWNQTGCDIYQP